MDSLLLKLVENNFLEGQGGRFKIAENVSAFLLSIHQTILAKCAKSKTNEDEEFTAEELRNVFPDVSENLVKFWVKAIQQDDSSDRFSNEEIFSLTADYFTPSPSPTPVNITARTRFFRAFIFLLEEILQLVQSKISADEQQILSAIASVGKSLKEEDADEDEDAEDPSDPSPFDVIFLSKAMILHALSSDEEFLALYDEVKQEINKKGSDIVSSDSLVLKFSKKAMLNQQPLSCEELSMISFYAEDEEFSRHCQSLLDALDWEKILSCDPETLEALDFQQNYFYDEPYHLNSGDSKLLEHSMNLATFLANCFQACLTENSAGYQSLLKKLNEAIKQCDSEESREILLVTLYKLNLLEADGQFVATIIAEWPVNEILENNVAKAIDEGNWHFLEALSRLNSSFKFELNDCAERFAAAIKSQVFYHRELQYLQRFIIATTKFGLQLNEPCSIEYDHLPSILFFVLDNFGSCEADDDGEKAYDETVDERDAEGKRPFAKGVAIFKVFVNAGADFNVSVDRDGYQIPLIVRAAELGNIRIVKYLLEKGVNINDWGGTDDGNDPIPVTALCLAAKRGREHVVRFLLDNGANPDGFRKDSNAPPLLFACQSTIHLVDGAKRYNEAIVKMLLQAGADVSLYKESPAFDRDHIFPEAFALLSLDKRRKTTN